MPVSYTHLLEAQLADLAKAEKFIFMEYHAIEDAQAWHKIQRAVSYTHLDVYKRQVRIRMVNVQHLFI